MLGGSNDHVIHSVLQPLALSVFKDWAGDAISHFSLAAGLGCWRTATYVQRHQVETALYEQTRGRGQHCLARSCLELQWGHK